MSAGLLAILLAVGWVAVTGTFTLPNLLLGIIVAVFVIFLLRHRLERPLPFRRVVATVWLIAFFIRELRLCAIDVARLAVAPRLRARLEPAIIAFPLTVESDAEITLLANLITLTPGTLTLDVSADHRLLYVHALTLGSREALIRSLANGLERRVIEVFR
jgi:multicomponent Na+:H+ antiporter subunit E